VGSVKSEEAVPMPDKRLGYLVGIFDRTFYLGVSTMRNITRKWFESALSKKT
jgi:hypothetical protein